MVEYWEDGQCLGGQLSGYDNYLLLYTVCTILQYYYAGGFLHSFARLFYRLMHSFSTELCCIKVIFTLLTICVNMRT